MPDSDNKIRGIISDDLKVFFVGLDFLKCVFFLFFVCWSLLNTRIEEYNYLHTSIVVNTVETARAAFCKPRTDANCETWTRTFDRRMLPFNTLPRQSPSSSLGLIFDLSTVDFVVVVVAFTWVLGDIGMMVVQNRERLTTPPHIVPSMRR